jgi:signal transduction histidine kinase
MRKRLAFVSLAVSALVVIAFVLPLAMLVRNYARDRALLSAEEETQALALVFTVVASESLNLDVDADRAQDVMDAIARERRPGLSIILPDDTVVGAPVEIGPSIQQARTGQAFTAYVEGGAQVLVPILPADMFEGELAVVRKLVTDEEMTRGVVAAWSMLGGLGIFLILVAVIGADRLGRSMVKPVSALAHAAKSLGEGNLATRVDSEGPEEVAEVAEAFNTLAGRLGSILEAERESVADLSHRLRTPLTALRLQAETLGDPIESANLLADIDRMERAVNRMIEEARSPSAEPAHPGASDLGTVLRHRAGFWDVLAAEQGRAAEVYTSDRPLPVPISADELGAVVDTLLANVFSYTAPGVGYRVSAGVAQNGATVLIVEDDGPGFPGEAVLERGASAGGSTGLGLDIALRSAERTGGRLTIGNHSGGGARVVATFGPVPHPQTPHKENRGPSGPRHSGTFTLDGSSR